jgi:fucose permease
MMMNIFSLLESFFFFFLGLSFILILLMVYHFKKRLDVLEKTNESLGEK